jgi:hypothetical protein
MKMTPAVQRKLRDTVLEAVRVHSPITAVEVEELHDLAFLPSGVVRKACLWLVKQGYVEEQGTKLVRCADGRLTVSTLLFYRKR